MTEVAASSVAPKVLQDDCPIMSSANPYVPRRADMPYCFNEIQIFRLVRLALSENWSKLASPAEMILASSYLNIHKEPRGASVKHYRGNLPPMKVPLTSNV